MQSTVTDTGSLLCSWVDNWFDDDINFQRNWIRQHASDGGFLGKPVRTAQSSTPHTSPLTHNFTLALATGTLFYPMVFWWLVVVWLCRLPSLSGKTVTVWVVCAQHFIGGLVPPGASRGVREVDQGRHQR